MTRPDYDPILQELSMDDFFPPDEQHPRRKSKRWIIVLLIVFFVLAVIGYWLYSEMLGYSAHSRVKSYLANAKSIYEVAQLWQEEGNPPLQSHIGQLGESTAEDSFGEYLDMYFSDDGWYAVECDADGNVLCVWYSRREITEDELWYIPWETTSEDLRSPFRLKHAVVCYPQEGGTPID